MTDPLELPFDVYQRYRLVTDLLGRLRETPGTEGSRLRVLDVGGRTAVLREFDLEDRIDLVDLEPLEGVEGLVLGDGCRLPFADDAFDAVCAFDTLEHVPPPAREAFVAECARVSRRWVLLAGPYDAARVAEAERLVQRFLREKLDYEHRYLEEHRDHGLPNRAATEEQLKGLGAQVVSVGHGNLDRWLALMCLALYMDLDASLRGLAKAFFRFYNAELYASDHAEPVYRHVVLAAKSGAPLPDLTDLLAPPAAPAGAVTPFATLTEELLAFDRERGEWRDEKEKFRRAVADLEADLKEHQGSLAERTAEVEARDARIEELGGERDAAQARIEELTHAVADLEGRLGAVEEDLATHRDVLAARDAQVAEQGEHIGHLEAHLRDRNEELKRKPMAVLRRVMWKLYGKPPTA